MTAGTRGGSGVTIDVLLAPIYLVLPLVEAQ